MSRFKNTYYVMRHGQSQANVAGLIVSDPAIGCENYGLTEQGREQIETSVAGFNETPPTVILCSDFLRTRETAALAATSFELSSTLPRTNTLLRERYFGDLDGKNDSHYTQVWANDEQQPDKEQYKAQGEQRVETVSHVLKRGLDLLSSLENSHQNEIILLVSHGDMLQILQTAFANKPAHLHRQLPHHETAQIKLLATIGTPQPASMS